MGADPATALAAPTAQLNPAWLALCCGLVPLIAVHLCYVLAASEGRVPWCIPYVEGCTSISRAARHGLSNPIFKGLMLPTAALIGLFWVLAVLRLREHAASHRARLHAMRALGHIGALFLVLYASFLGVEGEVYQLLRRYGVTVYFSFTVLAQMLLASLLPGGSMARRALVGLCGVMLLLGLASLPLQYLMEQRDAAVNAIEWCYALLMTSGFIVVAWEWQTAGFRLTGKQIERESDGCRVRALYE
ncbi:MAG: hypothetical protein ACT4QA_19405 [Panacagrimonas sp.]